LENEGFENSVVMSNLLFGREMLKLPEDVKKDPEGSLNKIVKTVQKMEPDILIIDSWREHIPFIAEFVRKFKPANENTKIILGGHHPTFIPNDIMELLPEVDYLVRGEIEISALELVKFLVKGGDLNKVKGISYRKNEKIFHTGDRAPIDNLDDLPIIDFENAIGNRKPERIDIRTQSGCWGSCNFCSLPSIFGKPRFHSVRYVINQIKHLKDLYDFDYLHLIDENFISNINRSKDVSNEIRKNFPDLEWGGMFRIDIARKDILEVLSNNNFVNACVGVESNIPKVLRFLNKTPIEKKYSDNIIDKIKFMSEKFRVLELGMIVGTPVETEKDLNSTIKFVEEIKRNCKNLEILRIAIGKLVIYPGTYFWNLYVKGKLKMIREDDNFEGMFEKKYEHIIWATPWRYFIENRNFNSQKEYINFIKNIINICSFDGGVN